LHGINYLLSVWNYCDFIPPVFIIVIVSIHLRLQTCKCYLSYR
jgi:hypothetical protein